MVHTEWNAYREPKSKNGYQKHIITRVNIKVKTSLHINGKHLTNEIAVDKTIGT